MTLITKGAASSAGSAVIPRIRLWWCRCARGCNRLRRGATIAFLTCRLRSHWSRGLCRRRGSRRCRRGRRSSAGRARSDGNVIDNRRIRSRHATQSHIWRAHHGALDLSWSDRNVQRRRRSGLNHRRRPLLFLNHASRSGRKRLLRRSLRWRLRKALLNIILPRVLLVIDRRGAVTRDLACRFALMLHVIKNNASSASIKTRHHHPLVIINLFEQGRDFAVDVFLSLNDCLFFSFAYLLPEVFNIRRIEGIGCHLVGKGTSIRHHGAWKHGKLRVHQRW